MVLSEMARRLAIWGGRSSPSRWNGPRGILWRWRIDLTLAGLNWRPRGVRRSAAWSSAAVSASLWSAARRAISSSVACGMQSRSGRLMVWRSLAPERQRIPTVSSSPCGWKVIVMSLTNARSSRLRSLWEVLSAAHSAGRSCASASICSRDGSGAGVVCSVSSASASRSSRSLVSQRVSRVRATRRFSGSQAWNARSARIAS